MNFWKSVKCSKHVQKKVKKDSKGEYLPDLAEQKWGSRALIWIFSVSGGDPAMFVAAEVAGRARVT